MKNLFAEEQEFCWRIVRAWRQNPMQNGIRVQVKRALDLVVFSDVHLGTFGCHAPELAEYLESIEAKTIILNGDIVDFWNLNKSFWPQSHMRILKLLTERAGRGTQIYYLTGNHDDVLRKFSDINLGNFSLLDKLVLEVGGKQCWFFHGDVFDSLVVEARWLAKLGSVGYDLLILMNRFFNRIMDLLGRPRFSLSKKIKNGVKQALLHIDKFERTLADLAIDANYDVVVCGHIHVPVIKEISGRRHEGKIIYMNSGDWIENLTALEFDGKEWSIYEHYKASAARDVKIKKGVADVEPLSSEVFL